jgi:hypothetical protein
MTNGFDKLLRESLTDEAAADTGVECPDAAVVAGWFDGTLSHAERTDLEAHAATCSRCQATIAALVRTDRPAARAWWRAPAHAVAGAGRGRRRGVADCLDWRAPHGRCGSAAVGSLRAARICRKGSSHGGGRQSGPAFFSCRSSRNCRFASEARSAACRWRA